MPAPLPPEFRRRAAEPARQGDEPDSPATHSFVSIMGDNGVPIETTADIVQDAGTAATEKVYRHPLNQ